MSKKVRGYFKRGLVFAMVLVTAMFMLTACGTNEEKSDKIKIVCTTFPSYDWISELTAGVENVELTLLQDKGVDLHSYQPTADDMIKIKESNLFVYVGGESDDWVDDAIEDIHREDFSAISLMQILGENVKQEEVKEGMQAEDEEHDADEHDADEHEDHDHDAEEVEYDEHVWLSLKNAETICAVLADKLEEINPENKDKISENAKSYIEKLSALDAEYEKTVSSATNKTVLFGDRFPFRYLVDDYGIDYFAAFVGCSAETEASFETVAFLSGKVDDLGLNTILTIDKSDKKIAKTIVANSKEKSAKILTLNSMQTVDKKQIDDGATYLKIMQENLNVLKEALK
jgi:ABC-type metal ion transport system, periplasmic component/surface adhesin